MSLPRFYIPPSRWNLETLVLEGDEARHCTHVLRMSAGDEIVVFNGRGAWAKSVIDSTDHKHVALRREASGLSPAPAVAITLLQAIPKGSNMDLIIEKAVELGVNAILPALTERTVVQVDPKEGARKQAKWQRIALEACKQCGQNWLPLVGAPTAYNKVWDSLPPHDLRIIAAIQPDSQSFKATLRTIRPSSVLMTIGPEGDFTPAEYALARSRGCVPVSLGTIILRVETAAMYCMSVLKHELT